MSVARSGRICELVPVPSNGHLLRWQPCSRGTVRNYDPVCIKRVGTLERLWRFMRRILPYFRKIPRQQRLRIGLTIPLLLSAPARAYQRTSELRDDKPLNDYPAWLQRHDQILIGDRRRMQRRIAGWKSIPPIRLHLLGDEPEQLERSLRSIATGCYPLTAVTVVTSVPVTGSWPFAFGQADAAHNDEWQWVLPAGSTLNPSALFRLADLGRQNPEVDWIYGDHDHLDADGQRLMPHFKPDWSPTLLLEQNYIGWCGAWRHQGAEIPCSASALYHHWLTLGSCVPACQIAHIPALLMQVPRSAEMANLSSAMQAIKEAFVRQQGWPVDVTTSRNGMSRMVWPLPVNSPLVSILVPTRNALSHLQPCLSSLLEKTDYAPFEVIIVDNQSDEAATLTYLEQVQSDPRVRVIRYDQPFNYSAINNLAVQAAQGELVCLLNNDTEVIAADWLREMVSHLLRDGVGVVGAKLYYGDGTVQHGGDAVGPGGCADHLHHRLPGDAPGYCQRALCAQELSAVTGACLLTHKSLYQQLGGLNAQDLPVAFNDVDYCLRVQEAGYRVVWTPHAELYHHESVSRGKELTPAQQARAARELAYMRRRWKQRLLHDPFYNPNLSYDRPDFSLSKAPRISRPWEA